MKKSLTAGLSALALAASAASVALVGGSTASHAAGTPSSAFGLEATGPIPIEATPYVESTDGSNVSDSLAEIPGDPLLNAGVVEVEAENNYARATVADLTVGDGLLAELPTEVTAPIVDGCAQLTEALQPVEGGLQDGTTEIESVFGEVTDQLADGTADTPLITTLPASIDEDLTALDFAALCDVLDGTLPLATVNAVEAECTGDTGDTTVADVTLLGGVDADVNTTTIASALGVEDLVTITENVQTTNPDGTFTVDGLVIELLAGGGEDVTETITVASATCGEVTRNVVEQDEAPAPTPVEANLPVTG